MNNENVLLKKFLTEYSRMGSRLFRFQCGLFWTGKNTGPAKNTTTITLQPGDIVLRKARPVKSGQPGIPDLIGWTNIQITPDMVGRTVAIFTAVEAKTEKVKVTKEQSSFIRTVNQAGGIAMIAKKLEDVLEATTHFLKGDRDESRH